MTVCPAVQRHTEWLRNWPKAVADAIRRAGKQVPAIVALKLEIDERLDVFVVDEMTRVRIGIGPLFRREP